MRGSTAFFLIWIRHFFHYLLFYMTTDVCKTIFFHNQLLSRNLKLSLSLIRCRGWGRHLWLIFKLLSVLISKWSLDYLMNLKLYKHKCCCNWSSCLDLYVNIQLHYLEFYLNLLTNFNFTYHVKLVNELFIINRLDH